MAEAAVASFASSTNAELAEVVTSNLGLTGDAKEEGNAYLTGKFNADPAARGKAILDAMTLLATLENDATWGAIATSFNNDVTASLTYSSNEANTAEAASDAAADALAASSETFTLTTGIDKLVDFTGGAADDTFEASTSAGVITLTSLDAIDGGDGSDTLDIAATAAVDTTGAVGAAVNGIESVNISSTGAIIADTSSWGGVLTLTSASTGNSTLTTAVTTDVNATVASATGAGAAVVNGGKDVTVTSTDTATTAVASANTITLGGTTAAAGTVLVTATESVTDAANAAIATGSVTVTGGTNITVNNLASVSTGSNAGDIATIGAIAINGDANTTEVTATQTAATAAWAAAGDNIKVTNGAVTIIDLNTATEADTIATATVSNFGASTFQGNVLSTLSLNGGGAAATASGAFAISQSAGVTTAGEIPTTLNLNTTGNMGVITDTNDQYTALNIASSGDATVAGLDFTNVTTLAASGDGVTTITASTDLGKVATITSTGGGLSLGGAIATTATFTGGDGKDGVEVTATTKAITTGAGDDTVTITASALGTDGSVDAGDDTDTLSMTAANAVTASATNTFEGTISNFEKLSLANVTASGTVNLANLDDLNTIDVAGVAGGQLLTLSNASSGATVNFADATQTATTVSLANAGSADVVNIALTAADAVATVAALTLTGFETLNFTTSDTDEDTTDAATVNVVTTLTNADATAINVSGNAGLTFTTATSATKLASFDATGVTAGVVSFTAGALTVESVFKAGVAGDTLNAAAATEAVTITGGAGADTLTGSSTKANTIDGGAEDDSITGGAAADTITGGAGTDTFTVTLAEQAGASTTVGIMVNLSDASVSQSAVFTATGDYLASTGATIASNTAAFLYNGESTTDAVVVDTLDGIENVIGSSGTDYIIGSAGDNSITGSTGLDKVTGGDGADVFVQAATDSIARTAETLTDGGVANADTITFGNGVDIITDFVSGTDTIDVESAGAATTLMAVDPTGAALTNAVTYSVLGTFVESTGVFTVNSAATSATANVATALLVAEAADADAAAQTGWVVLTGVTSVAAADLV
jgi:S-layer protein